MKMAITPYLIQRGMFRDVKLEEIVGIDSLIIFDYMGSAEFEFGALPRSLRRIVVNLAEYELVQVNDIVDRDNNVLFVFCLKDQKEEVIEAIKGLGSRKFRLKEFSAFDYHVKSAIGQRDEDARWWMKRVNFWWDIQHDYMFCFTSDHGERIKLAIEKVKERWKKENKL
jgi:hypothetical protein